MWKKGRKPPAPPPPPKPKSFSPDRTIRDLVRTLFGAEVKPDGEVYLQCGSADERGAGEIFLQLGLTIIPDPNASVVDRLGDLLRQEERRALTCNGDGFVSTRVVDLHPDGIERSLFG